jgi:hypothetical protein
MRRVPASQLSRRNLFKFNAMKSTNENEICLKNDGILNLILIIRLETPRKIKKINAKSRYFSVFHANKVKKYISILYSL